MATTNIQSFAGDVEVAGELTVTGQLNSTTGSDKVKLTATTASETDYIPLSKGTTGAQPLYTDSNLTYNPANNVLAANLSGSVSGNVSGNVTGNVSGNVTGNVSGNAAFATNATYATNAGQLDGSTKSTGANANSICQRDGSGHLYMVYGFSGYLNMSHGAATRTGDTTFYSSYDDYIRKNTASGMRASLNVPTRTGGDASGTWSINVNGSAANAGYANSAGSATNATFATSATHANAANAVKFTDRDSTNNTDYIAFVDSHSQGDKALFTDSSLTYNSSSNYLNANVPYANAAGSATNATYAGNAGNAGYANQAGYVSGGVCKYYLKYVTTQRLYPATTNHHVYDMDFNYAAERSNSTLVIQYSLFYEASNNRTFLTTVNGGYYPYQMNNIRQGVAVNNYDVDTDSTPHSFMFTVHYAPGTTANRIYRLYNRSSTNSTQGFAINRAWNTGPQNSEYGISYVLVQEFAA